MSDVLILLVVVAILAFVAGFGTCVALVKWENRHDRRPGYLP